MSDISPVSDILQEVTEVVIVPGRRGGKEIYLWVNDKDFELMQTQKSASACIQKFLHQVLPRARIMESDVHADVDTHADVSVRISSV